MARLAVAREDEAGLPILVLQARERLAFEEGDVEVVCPPGWGFSCCQTSRAAARTSTAGAPSLMSRAIEE